MYKIIVLFLLGLLVLPNSNAQQVFYSQSLQDFYYSLPDTRIFNTLKTDTVVLCSDIVQGDIVPLVFCFDENTVLEHVGFRFLPAYGSFTNVIVRFIERELLTLLTTNDINQTFVSYRENSVSVLMNGSQIEQSTLQNKPKLLRLLKSIQGITINYEGRKYEVLLSIKKGQKLSFNFPADSELITGMDKSERDIRLAVQLKNHRAKSGITVTVPDDLKSLRESVYTKEGRSFMIPQINNDIFYTKIDSSYSLIFDSLLLAETFSNTLLVPSNQNYTINVTHRMYGNKVKKYTVNSRDFDDYFRNGYERYFGIETLESEKLSGTLILNDRNAANIHLAFIQVKKKNLLNGGVMDIHLYSNIPQQNLKTLFDKINHLKQ
jgi:predicted component of type VI protein secretion system